MKTVSVIIPFYSNVEWLYEAMESVLSQTYPIHEIILINDGSKEDLSEFLSKYSDNIHIYINQENKGQGAARNIGIRRATGDYIAFEDSDDVWHPTKIEKQVQFMEETGAMWSHTGFNYWWPKTGKVKMVDSSRDYGDIFLQKHISTKIATPTVMLNREIYNKADFFFPEQTRNGEDDQLYTMISKHYPIALVQEPLVNVRMRGTNSQNKVIERFHLRVQNYESWKSEGQQLTIMIHIIYSFYRLYAKLFGNKSNKFIDFLAKCCWTIPYILERVYVRYLHKQVKKDNKYIKKYR